MEIRDYVEWHWFVTIHGAWQRCHTMWLVNRYYVYFSYYATDNFPYILSNVFRNITIFSIALNADNLAANRVVYVAATGAVDFSSLILSMTLLNFFGRKISSCGLFALSGFFLLSLIVIPRGIILCFYMFHWRWLID